MTALTQDPRLWWILLLVCSCAFALGVMVGILGFRFVVRPLIRARDEAISAAIVAVYPVMARDIGSISPDVWTSFAVQAGRFVAMARAIPDLRGFRWETTSMPAVFRRNRAQ